MTAAANGNWYMVNRDGMATLCADREDAEKEAADAQSVWPHMGPHRAVRLVEASFEAADMATAAAQGFRDGVASLAANAGGPVVNRATVIEWLYANDIEVTYRQLGGLFHFSAPPATQAEGWMDIATAPKDGTLILVNFGIKGVRAVSWDSPFHDEVTEENGAWCVDDDKHGPYGLRGYNDYGPTAPTHWMKLPESPYGKN